LPVDWWRRPDAWGGLRKPAGAISNPHHASRRPAPRGQVLDPAAPSPGTAARRSLRQPLPFAACRSLPRASWAVGVEPAAGAGPPWPGACGVGQTRTAPPSKRLWRLAKLVLNWGPRRLAATRAGNPSPTVVRWRSGPWPAPPPQLAQRSSAAGHQQQKHPAPLPGAWAPCPRVDSLGRNGGAQAAVASPHRWRLEPAGAEAPRFGRSALPGLPARLAEPLHGPKQALQVAQAPAGDLPASNTRRRWVGPGRAGYGWAEEASPSLNCPCQGPHAIGAEPPAGQSVPDRPTNPAAELGPIRAHFPWSHSLPLQR